MRSSESDHENDVHQEADFQHKLALIWINRTYGELGPYDAVRYSWKIDLKRARNCDYILAVFRGLIVGAYIADEWLPATKENFPNFPRDGTSARPERYGFRGSEAPAEVKKLYCERRVPEKLRRQGAAYPIRYVNV